MVKQVVILCDLEGNSLNKFMDKEEAHKGKGNHHLAITVLIYNLHGQVLLQKRKHKRFDGAWDLTGATDLYHYEDHDETFDESTLRCLKREYQIEDIKLENLGYFNYFAKDGKMAENELCALLIGPYDGELSADPSVAYEIKWVDKNDFLKDITDNPTKYSPWAIESISLLNKNKFFDR